jgi:uncharacterized protein
LDVKGKPGRVSRKQFLGAGGAGAAAFVLGALADKSGPLGALGARGALGQSAPRVEGYGPIGPSNGPDLLLPQGFRYRIVSRQGEPMSDGNPTPGIFDGMGAYPGPRGTTILIRNHENRRRPGEIPVVVPADKRYDQDPTYTAGDTKLVLDRRGNVIRSFAILGGTDTNCAGGETPWGAWITCEEVVNRSAAGKKHGYVFEIDAYAEGPVDAIPILSAGRMSHEAVAYLDGILYETEDRSISADGGACFYRYLPADTGDDDDRDRDRDDDRESIPDGGRLQALKLRGEDRANMDTGRPVGQAYRVEWVAVPVPDHDDDTDRLRTGPDNLLPTRFQAQNRGAAIFDREEGIWVGDGKIYFDCTFGGAQNLGQVWEYDPDRETITLIYESSDPNVLQNPDNVVIVPRTGDIFLQEDGPDEDGQFVRGLTEDGEIYDFARTVTNNTEFCGGCFSPDGNTFFLNQQGERGGPIGDGGQPVPNATTYAITGPFARRRRAGNDGDDD